VRLNAKRSNIIKSVVTLSFVLVTPVALAGVAEDFLSDLPDGVKTPTKTKSKVKINANATPPPKYLSEQQIIRNTDGDAIGYVIRGEGTRVTLFSIDGTELGFSEEKNGKTIFTTSLAAVRMEAEWNQQKREESKQWIDEFNRSQERKRQEALQGLIELDRNIKQSNRRRPITTECHSIGNSLNCTQY
jgi:hypothetical protein